MSDYMTLLGAEQVQSAANCMVSAADDMQRTASSISESVDRMVRALDEHAIRIEDAMRTSTNSPGIASKLVDGVQLIAAERARQFEIEHHTLEEDRRHVHCELARAAACYAMPTGYRECEPPLNWPWHSSWWKPSPDDRVRDLVKAGALCAAEIDRLLAAKR